MTRGGGSRGAKRGARRAARSAPPWIEGMARFGYAAYGVVYLLVGVLSVRAAGVAADRTTGPRRSCNSPSAAGW